MRSICFYGWIRSYRRGRERGRVRNRTGLVAGLVKWLVVPLRQIVMICVRWFSCIRSFTTVYRKNTIAYGFRISSYTVRVCGCEYYIHPPTHRINPSYSMKFPEKFFVFEKRITNFSKRGILNASFYIKNLVFVAMLKKRIFSEESIKLIRASH